MVSTERPYGERVEKMITAVVVDDHPFYRDGVARGLAQSGRIRVLGEADGGREGLELIARVRPQVAVVDYQMPLMTGIEVVESIVRDGIETRVLLVSAVTESAIVYAALEAGAGGYISKDAARTEIVAAVADIADGKVVVPPELTAGLVGEIRQRRSTSAPLLTDREREVLQGFARGQSIPAIAAELFLSANTVKTHAQRLYEKLGVSDRAAAVAVGMRQRLVD
jgi:two-component system nitrate/nitrite response regulator NarL